MIEIFWSICFITAILLVWFNSEALVEWGTLFGLSDVLKTKEFYNTRLELLPTDVSYPSFLKIKYPTFLTKLLACPICLTFWISLWMCCCFSVLLMNLAFILATPIVMVGSLITYGIVVKLLSLV